MYLQLDIQHHELGFQVCFRIIENSLLVHFVVKICVFGKFYSSFTAQHLVYCLLYVLDSFLIKIPTHRLTIF